MCECALRSERQSECGVTVAIVGRNCLCDFVWLLVEDILWEGVVGVVSSLQGVGVLCWVVGGGL